MYYKIQDSILHSHKNSLILTLYFKTSFCLNDFVIYWLPVDMHHGIVTNLMKKWSLIIGDISRRQKSWDHIFFWMKLHQSENESILHEYCRSGIRRKDSAVSFSLIQSFKSKLKNSSHNHHYITEIVLFIFLMFSGTLNEKLETATCIFLEDTQIPQRVTKKK